MGKEEYRIKLRDLIHIKGLFAYADRVMKNYYFYNIGPKIERRVCALEVYNVILLGGSVVGLIKGLEALLK